jgi:hypothetical protein
MTFQNVTRSKTLSFSIISANIADKSIDGKDGYREENFARRRFTKN